MSALPKRKYTIEEYGELIKTTEEKAEYFDGEIVSMRGDTIAHAEIVSNVMLALHRRLTAGGCRVLSGDLALKVPAAPPFRFPDACVISGEPSIETLQGIDLLVNPILIVEVLAKAPKGYELSEKFAAYQSIASFQEYWVISQKDAHVIQHTRQPNQCWLRRDLIDLDSYIQFEALDISLPLKEIYENVQFPSPEKR